MELLQARNNDHERDLVSSRNELDALRAARDHLGNQVCMRMRARNGDRGKRGRWR